jgi:hypothetical protein
MTDHPPAGAGAGFAVAVIPPPHDPNAPPVLVGATRATTAAT